MTSPGSPGSPSPKMESFVNMTLKTKAWIVCGMVVAGLTIGMLVVYPGKQPPKDGQTLSGDMRQPDVPEAGVRPSDAQAPDENAIASPQARVPDKGDIVVWAVASLKKEFADRIELKSSQAELIRLRQFLAEKYPDAWEALFKQIITLAFPDKADTIFSTLAQLDNYNAWLEANKQDLANLDHDQIMETLWAKRRELFGDDATELWSEETRTEAIIDVLDIMRESYDTTLDEKLAIYVQAINQAYEDSVGAFMENRKFYLSRAFFSMDSAQDNLKSMTPAQRAQSIHDVRIAMGYSEEECEKLAQNDEKNEQRWQQGFRYMDERAKILASYQGDAQKEKLTALQNTYFSKQAKTIQAEEASGFFRFSRPRVYGSN